MTLNADYQLADSSQVRKALPEGWRLPNEADADFMQRAGSQYFGFAAGYQVLPVGSIAVEADMGASALAGASTPDSGIDAGADLAAQMADLKKRVAALEAAAGPAQGV